MNRRTFCLSAAAAAASTRAGALAAPAAPAPVNRPLITLNEIERIDRERILRAAGEYLTEAPITMTALSAVHGGSTNAQNPAGQDEALIRMSLIVPALTAAWLITGEKHYAEHAAKHLHAWFLDPATRMNPPLARAQTAEGAAPMRGAGIAGTVHLIEVTRAARHLETAQAMTAGEFAGLRAWFAEYLLWMRASAAGQEEEAEKNHRGTCWVAQAAAYAAYTGNESAMALCRERFRNHLLPEQMAADGSFPAELTQPSPYNFSLFNLDLLAMVCVIASAGGPGPVGATNDLWQFALPNGNRFKTAVDFLFPYIEDKSRWPYARDAESFGDLPGRRPSLLFAGLVYREPKYIALWRTLPSQPETAAVLRNFPVRQPVLWLRPA
ncbi:MAG: alginate lyase family protein [Terracidiphilus sp.]|jgi:hypothetical protein